MATRKIPLSRSRQASADRMTAMAQSYAGGYEGTPASQRKAGAKSGTKIAGPRKTATSKYPTKGGAPSMQRSRRASSDRSTAMAQSYAGGYEGTPASQRRAGAKSGAKIAAPRKSATSKYPSKGGRPVMKMAKGRKKA